MDTITSVQPPSKWQHFIIQCGVALNAGLLRVERNGSEPELVRDSRAAPGPLERLYLAVDLRRSENLPGGTGNLQLREEEKK